jgi:hypothetical protein
MSPGSDYYKSPGTYSYSIPNASSRFNIPIQSIAGYPTLRTLKNVVDTFSGTNIKNFKVEMRYTGTSDGWDCWQYWKVDLYVPNKSGWDNDFYYSNQFDPGRFDADSGWKEVYSGAVLSGPNFQNGFLLRTNWGGSGSGCAWKGRDIWYNVRLQIRISGSVNVADFCMTNLLNKDICTQYCLDPFNEDCFEAVKKNCFTRKTADYFSEPFFDDNSVCSKWVKDATKKRPGSDLDSEISKVCVDNLVNAQNYEQDLGIKQRCSCFLDPSVYDNYRSDLVSIIPSFGLQPGNTRCVFPFCQSADYVHSTTVGQNGNTTCPTFTCIQGLSLDVRGKINTEGGDINLNANADCLNYLSGNSQGNCDTNDDCRQFGADYMCQNKVCLRFKVLTCERDQDCTPGYKCSNGKCERVISTRCSRDADCDITRSESCVNGVCVSSEQSQMSNTIIIGVIVAILLVIITGFVIFLFTRKKGTNSSRSKSESTDSSSKSDEIK